MAKFLSNQIVLTSLFLVANIESALAQSVNNYEDFKLYCSEIAYQYGVASPDCDRYQQYHQDQIIEEVNQEPNNNIEPAKIKRRNAEANDISGYAGISFGVFFPDQEDADTGFGDSLFVGGRWNRYVATDIEALGFIDGFDYDYLVWALTINPRLIIPFNENYNSASFYVSPGLGISIVDANETTTDLAWQIKAGFTIPIKEKFNIFLQGRYISQFEESNNSAFGTELGFSVNFQ